MTIIGLSCGLDNETGRQNYALRKYYQMALAPFEVALVTLPVQRGQALTELVDTIDGLILTGGGDIHPSFWQEEPSGNLKIVGNYDLERDYFEIELVKTALRLKKPLLGICRGLQVINVGLGGSLWQDLANLNTLNHQQTAPEDQLWHQIITTSPSIVDFFGKTEFYVNSFHHQGIKDLSSNLTVGAISNDAVIELVYNFKQNFVLGVQWHPERLAAYHEPSKKIFEAFINAVKTNNNPT